MAMLAVTAAFPDAVAGRRSLLPARALAADPLYRAAFPPGTTPESWDQSGILVHYPAERLAAAELRAGRAPLWNPYSGTGAPLLAEAHSAPLSPFLFPFWLSPSETTYTWALLLRFVVAAAGTFMLARTRGQGRAAAAVAAATYALGGCAATRFDLPTEGTAYAMLPLVALAASAVVHRGARALALLAIAVGATIYAAHPELAALAGGGGLLVAACEAPRDRRAWLRLAGGLLLGVGVGAAVVLPLLDYLRAGGTSYKLKPELAQLFAGELRFLRAKPEFLRFGAAPLLLAGVALATLRPGRAAIRRPGTLVAARAAGLAAAVVVSFYVVQAAAPDVWAMLVPPKYTLFLLVFALALLAGEGTETLLQGATRHVELAAAAAGTALVWLGADALTRFRLHQRTDVWLGDALAAAAVVAAAAVIRKLPVMVAPPLAPAGRARSLRLRLAPGARISRPPLEAWRALLGAGLAVAVAAPLLCSARRIVVGMSGGMPATEAAAVIRRVAPAPARVAGLAWTMTPNTAALLGSSDARAFAAVFPARYRAFMSIVDGVRTLPTASLLNHARSPLIDLLGVTHLASAAPAPPRGWEVVYRDAHVMVARNPDAAPRVFVPRAVVPAGGPAESLERLAALVEAGGEGGLPFTAVVEAPLDVLAAHPGTAGEARIAEYLPSRVVLEVELPAPALVVLTDTFADGWVARVDGAPAPIYPADHLFRAVPVDAGRHRVVMTYEPAVFDLGLAVAGLSLVVALGISLRARRERARA